MGIRQLVSLIENGIIASLADYGIDAQAKPEAPGVYVDGKKIASLGLRVRKGCSFSWPCTECKYEFSPLFTY